MYHMMHLINTSLHIYTILIYITINIHSFSYRCVDNGAPLFHSVQWLLSNGLYLWISKVFRNHIREGIRSLLWRFFKAFIVSLLVFTFFHAMVLNYTATNSSRHNRLQFDLFKVALRVNPLYFSMNMSFYALNIIAGTLVR
jgi:hypothetical protein